ncbi:uncharacterized protein RJT21DRAFT_37660 [Scheffersomyces amazonensis]|uniref:uncharacterized protein n=1 Tax=Scheffersomyces amazonensis TaxID=1078765 RepID=UPI00315C72E3
MTNVTYITPNPKGYTVSVGVIRIIEAVNNGAADGTGIHKILNLAKGIIGPNLPLPIVQYCVGIQNNLLGGYPSHWEIIPSSIFVVIFAILFIVHLFIFIVNFTRGHFFTLSLGWSFAALLRLSSFALRISWAQDINRVLIGIANEILFVLPTVFLVSFNLVLAQRLFTWRHPVGGSRKLFWGFMMGLYIFVFGIVALTIVASATPYLAFLSSHMYLSYKKCVMATAILVIVYALTAVALIGLSFWLPTSKDENLYTYQPWWIESFHPFYFVPKGAAREAEQTFMKRNHNHRHAIRVIAATHHHYKMVEGLSNERGDLKHNISLLVIIISTILLFLSNVIRCVIVFQSRYNYYASPLAQPAVMYLVWGGFELIMHLGYILGRADLRFYRPDILPEVVRSIVTAEQSGMISEAESEANSEDYYAQQYGINSFEDEEISHTSLERINVPPRYSYPSEISQKRDDESEFYF